MFIGSWYIMENRMLSFKKVSEESYKDVAPYIDALIPHVTFLSDLYLVDFEGHRFLIMENDNKLIIVDNNEGVLNTFSLEFDSMGRIVRYSDDLGEYELSLETEDIIGVRSVDKLSGIIDQLVYFPSAENDPRINIDYYQYFPNDVSSVVFNYDVTHRNSSLEAALLYTNYRCPNKIVLSQLTYLLKVIGHKKEDIFYDDLKEDRYCRALFKFRNILFPEFNIRYPKDKVLYAIEDLGYKVKIPSKMKELLCGSDQDLKRLQLLADAYKKREKDKKIQ